MVKFKVFDKERDHILFVRRSKMPFFISYHYELLVNILLVEKATFEIEDKFVSSVWPVQV